MAVVRTVRHFRCSGRSNFKLYTDSHKQYHALKCSKWPVYYNTLLIETLKLMTPAPRSLMKIARHKSLLTFYMINGYKGQEMAQQVVCSLVDSRR